MATKPARYFFLVRKTTEWRVPAADAKEALALVDARNADATVMHTDTWVAEETTAPAVEEVAL